MEGFLLGIIGVIVGNPHRIGHHFNPEFRRPQIRFGMQKDLVLAASISPRETLS